MFFAHLQRQYTQSAANRSSFVTADKGPSWEQAFLYHLENKQKWKIYVWTDDRKQKSKASISRSQVAASFAIQNFYSLI